MVSVLTFLKIVLLIVPINCQNFANLDSTDWEGYGRNVSLYLWSTVSDFLERLRKQPQLSVLLYIPGEIRTGHLSSTGTQSYSYTAIFGTRWMLCNLCSWYDVVKIAVVSEVTSIQSELLFRRRAKICNAVDVWVSSCLQFSSAFRPADLWTDARRIVIAAPHYFAPRSSF